MAPSGTGTAAFAFRDFRRYQLARVMVIMGAEAQALAVAWQVYEITHRAIDLGYTGLVLFLPGLLFLLPAGHVADRYDRRMVILVCYVLQILCTLVLLIFALQGLHRVEPIFAVLFLIGTGRAFSGPASSALLPHLVPTENFVNAITWGATVFQVANIAGPAVGGLLYTLPLKGRLYGAPIVFLFTLATGIGLVLLGGATALLPIFAHDLLHTGPQGLGALRSAPALGALAVSVWLTFRPVLRRPGVTMFVGVAVFGAATVVFGLSWTLPLSLATLMLVGASDMISVVIRSSMLQLATPASMRGRVSAVNSLFVGASNELGEFESGVTAQWWGATRAVVVGGLGALVITGIWSVLFPSIRSIDRLTGTSLLQVEES